MEEELDSPFDLRRSGLPYPPKDVHDFDVPVLVCLAGFPDTASVWDPMINHKGLQSTHHVITLGLPGFHEKELPPSYKLGYSIHQILQELHKVIQYCHRQHPCKQATIHLVGHDWGAVYCYHYIQDHPDIVDKYASLDVGLLAHPATIEENLRLISYFLIFSLAFIVYNLLRPARLGKACASLMIALYPWNFLGPLNKQTNLVFLPRVKQSPHLTYPYFQFAKEMITRGRYSSPVRFSKIKHLPQCCIYGTKKNVMYHSKRYLNQLKTTRGCSWHMIEGGHWFYTEPEHSHAVAQILMKFFLDER